LGHSPSAAQRKVNARDFFWGLTHKDWHNQIAVHGTGEK